MIYHPDFGDFILLRSEVFNLCADSRNRNAASLPNLRDVIR